MQKSASVSTQENTSSQLLHIKHGNDYPLSFSLPVIQFLVFRNQMDFRGGDAFAPGGHEFTFPLPSQNSCSALSSEQKITTYSPPSLLQPHILSQCSSERVMLSGKRECHDTASCPRLYSPNSVPSGVNTPKVKKNISVQEKSLLNLTRQKKYLF